MPRFRKSGYFEAFCGPDEAKVPVCITGGGCDYVDDASLSLLAQQLSKHTLSSSPTSLECPSTPWTLPALSRSNTITSTTSTSSRADSVAFNNLDHSPAASTVPTFRLVDYSVSSTASADLNLSPLDRPPTPLLCPTYSNHSAPSSHGCYSTASRRRNALSSPSTSPRLPARLLLLDSTTRSRTVRSRRPAQHLSEARREALRSCWAEACCEQGERQCEGNGGDEYHEEENTMAIDDCTEELVCPSRPGCASSWPRRHSGQHQHHQRTRKVVGSELRGRPRRVATY